MNYFEKHPLSVVSLRLDIESCLFLFPRGDWMDYWGMPSSATLLWIYRIQPSDRLWIIGEASVISAFTTYGRILPCSVMMRDSFDYGHDERHRRY